MRALVGSVRFPQLEAKPQQLFLGRSLKSSYCTHAYRTEGTAKHEAFVDESYILLSTVTLLTNDG